MASPGRLRAGSGRPGVACLVTVTSADIPALPFEDAAFDMVIVEAG
jgi:ubiquinone/menaquinone biosynthesis C-methylase UbiE